MRYILILLLFILTSCSDSWVEPDKHVYIDFTDTTSNKVNSSLSGDSSGYIRIAVASMSTPAETFFKYHDLFTYIEDKLKRKILLVQRKTYKEVNNLLKQNLIDMAFICSGAYVAGAAESAFDLFLIPERNNQHYYQAYVIVRQDSPFNNFSDLKGKKFAFSDSLSNTGMYYPLVRLNQLNSSPEDFFAENYMSNAHDNSIELVSRGIVDGASVNSLVYEYTSKMNPEKVMNLKIIEKSPFFGIPPVVVSKAIDTALKNDLFGIMTGMVKEKEGREVLKSLMINRFVPENDTIYNGIREMCRGVCDHLQ